MEKSKTMATSTTEKTPLQDLIRRNLLWYSGGLLALAASATAAAHMYVDKLIDDKVKGAVTAGIPGDAVGFVAMFSGGCPDGWTLHPDAQGRMPVGAGTHQNQDERGVTITSYPPLKVGGEEAHVLSIPEMPRHNHGGLWGGSLSVAGMTGTNQEHTSGHIQIMPEGDGVAHNNMPPYIAFSFCVKSGAPRGAGQN